MLFNLCREFNPSKQQLTISINSSSFNTYPLFSNVRIEPHWLYSITIYSSYTPQTHHPPIAILSQYIVVSHSISRLALLQQTQLSFKPAVILIHFHLSHHHEIVRLPIHSKIHLANASTHNQSNTLSTPLRASSSTRNCSQYSLQGVTNQYTINL